LRNGDLITFPKKPNFVMVNGAVYNSTAVTYRSGKPAGWYLTQAGGATPIANKKAIFLVRADGSVVAGSGGLFKGGVLAAEVRPGDMLVVPERAYTGSTKWKTALQASQVVGAIGIAVSVARSF
jgi:protein involved in polysaccharide export with SLBB domain